MASLPSARAQVAPASPAQSARPPQPTTGTGLMLGQVVDAAGGGVSNAIVTLNGGWVQTGSLATQIQPGPIGGGPRRTITSADGHFLFNDLPKGTYSIDATKSGYVSGSFGRYRPEGLPQSLELGDGERNGNVKIAMWKYAAISGTLTDDSGEPFVGATIWCLKRSYAIGRSQFTDGPSATSDDRGFFRVSGLTPGEYLIGVVASQSTMPAALAEGWAQAMLTGTTSEFQRQFSSVGFYPSLSSPGIRIGDAVLYTTGQYSRGMTPPGPDETGRVLSFQTTFYPGATTSAQAEVITLTSGQERTGADIRLNLVPTVPFSGTIVGPNGPAANIGVRLAPEFSGELGNELSFEAATTITDANGRFSFLGVPVGQYTLRALRVPPAPAFVPPPPVPPGSPPPAPPPPPPIPQEPTLWANQPVTISAEGVPNLTVRLNAGFRISGRFVFEGTTLPKPSGDLIQTLNLLIQPVDGHQIGFASALRSRTDPDGTFTTYEIPPGKYSIRMSAPTETFAAMPGWLYKSSLQNGRDIGSSPLDLQGDVADLVITMTDHPSEISGTVRDENGRGDPKAMVLVFSADSSHWSYFGETPRRIRQLRPTVTGMFRVSSLPPGQYFVAAVPEGDAGDWRDPRALLQISRTAVKVTLGDGEKKVQDVVTKAIR